MKRVLPPFEKDMSRASTLPGFVYKDADLHCEELSRIFAATWQPVGNAVDVAKPGDFFTCEVAGEPVVVLRDTEGVLRSFYNVCRHRAGPLVEGKGTRKSLTCRYHGWTYATDGRLLHTPEFEGVNAFDKACFGLVPIPVATWGPWVFVNLGAEPKPLLESLGRIPTETASYDLAGMRPLARRDYVVECNWKVYVENFLEGYHLPIVHPGLYRELDYAKYRVDTFESYSSQYAPIRKAEAKPGERPRQYEGTGEDGALYYWVFPNWMLNIYPDNASINIIVPVGTDRTVTIFEWFGKGDVDIERIMAFSDEIQKEDIGICEAVQKRLGSRGYPGGRFSVKRENGVHHFQGLLHDYLTR